MAHAPEPSHPLAKCLGRSVKVPDGRIGILLTFRVEADRAVVQFLDKGNGWYRSEEFKLSELSAVQENGVG
jgi:hypothetical protein